MTAVPARRAALDIGAAGLVALAALGLIVLAAAGIARARRRSRPPAEGGAEVAPGVFCLGPWGRTQTNVYLVRAGSSWMLVDAGWEADAGRIDAAVRSRLGPDAVPLAILLTHVHPDHAGSARALAEGWACPVLVHPAEVAIASGEFGAMERFAGPLDRSLILPTMRLMGARRRAAILERNSLAGFIRELEPDGSIAGLEGWRWMATPGHTPGHVAFVRDADRVVLTGDALVTLRVNHPAGILLGRQGLSGPPWYTTWDRTAAAASIAAIARLEPTMIGGGHGRPQVGPSLAARLSAYASAAARRSAR